MICSFTGFECKHDCVCKRTGFCPECLEPNDYDCDIGSATIEELRLQNGDDGRDY